MKILKEQDYSTQLEMFNFAGRLQNDFDYFFPLTDDEILYNIFGEKVYIPFTHYVEISGTEVPVDDDIMSTVKMLTEKGFSLDEIGINFEEKPYLAMWCAFPSELLPIRKYLHDFMVFKKDGIYHSAKSGEEVDYDSCEEIRINNMYVYLNIRYFFAEIFKKRIEEATEFKIEKALQIESPETFGWIMSQVTTLAPELLELKEVERYTHTITDKNEYAKLTHELGDATAEDGQKHNEYRLMHGKVQNIDLAYVKAVCRSTGRSFYLSVKFGNNLKDSCGTWVMLDSALIPHIKSIVRQGECYVPIYDCPTKDVKRSGIIVPLTGEQYFKFVNIQS